MIGNLDIENPFWFYLILFVHVQNPSTIDSKSQNQLRAEALLLRVSFRVPALILIKEKLIQSMLSVPSVSFGESFIQFL